MQSSVQSRWSSHPNHKYNSVSSCIINEIKFTGVETIVSENPDYTCKVQFNQDGVLTPITNTIQYQGSATPLLTDIQPRFGKVLGGTEVTFTGTTFSVVKEEISVIIDGIPCVVSSSTTTQIKCITGKRPGLVATSLDISFKTHGRASLQQKVYTYVNAWSDDTTWGGEFAPLEMETIYIPPGLNLLVDVDKTELLNAVIVEGSLIFAPE